MHLIKCVLKLIKKSVCICQVSEVKIVLFKATCKKQVSQAIYMSSFGLYSFLLWTEVLLEFLVLLVSDNRTTSIPGARFLNLCPHAVSPLRYNNKDPSGYIFPPSPNTLNDTFLKEGSGKIFANKDIHCV